MLYEKDNEAINAELSKQRLKYESEFGNKKDLINTSNFNSDVTFNIEYIGEKQENLRNLNECSTFNAVNEKIILQEGSFTHNLHPNIEVFAHSLLKKIDTLQQSQLDIHNVEIITDRAFHSVEKLKYEVKDVKDYIQKIESRNKSLEAKIDLLITQNEAMNITYTQLQTMCEHFFSNSKNLESKDVNSQKNFRPIENTTANITENYIHTQSKIDDNNNSKLVKVQESVNTNHNIAINEKENITDLIKSKKQIETFIKKNYPDDYLKIKQYNKANIFDWVKNRVLKFN